jgi:hypothetical protein
MLVSADQSSQCSMLAFRDSGGASELCYDASLHNIFYVAPLWPGGYVGGMLTKAGVDVTFIESWQAHIDAVWVNELLVTTTSLL